MGIGVGVEVTTGMGEGLARAPLERKQIPPIIENFISFVVVAKALSTLEVFSI